MPAYSGFTWPVEPLSKISSYFGNRAAPTHGASTYHKGVDIAVPTGTNVRSALSGIVEFAGYSSSAGNYIKVNNGNGVVTQYMHLSKLGVAKGQSVQQGAVIGLSGNTGRSTGPHLHFGILVNGKAVDPLSYNYKGTSSAGISTAAEQSSGALGVDFGSVLNNIDVQGVTDGIKEYWLYIVCFLAVVAIFK